MYHTHSRTKMYRDLGNSVFTVANQSMYASKNTHPPYMHGQLDMNHSGESFGKKTYIRYIFNNLPCGLIKTSGKNSRLCQINEEMAAAQGQEENSEQ